jgi:hypothetical protein
MSDANPTAQPAVTNANPYRIADPVVDCAQGRPMVVIDAPAQTVAEWSDANNYDLTENYANSKFGCHAEEYVVECVYVSDVRSEPSKTYTFPASRLRLIDAHHADDGRRLADRVLEGVAEALFAAAIQNGADGTLPSPADVAALCAAANLPYDAVDAGETLAKATHGKDAYLNADAEGSE